MSATWDSQAEKATPIAADEILIIDTEDSRTQKRATLSSFGTAIWTRDDTNGFIYPVTLTDFLGIGTNIPLAQIDSLSTSEQLRLSYDSTNYASFTVSIEGFDISTASYDGDTNGKFSVTAEVTLLFGLTFNTDGTKMYVVGELNTSVFQYTLTTGFDISTASYDGDANGKFTIAEDASPRDIAFNTDGTKMYIVGTINDSVYQYTLTTGFDISTASYDGDANGKFTIAEDASPEGIAFNTDGTKMYIVGTINDSVYQYTLTTGFDISTASYDGDANGKFTIAEDTLPYGLTFNTDGTKMYIIGDTNNSVFQYSLTTEFDISTASYDGDTLGKFSVTAEVTTPRDIVFNTDGTKMYVVGEINRSVFQYSLTPTSLLTIAPSGGETNITGNLTVDTTTLFVDSTTNFVGIGTLAPLALLNSLSTSEQLRLSYDADNYVSFVVSIEGFDVSTAVYDTILFSVAGQETTPYGLTFNTDGTKMYVVGTVNDTVYEYTLTTGFDLDTATTTGVVSFPIAEDATPRGVAFNTDGTKMYVVGATNANVFEYDLSTAFLVTSAVYNTIFFSVSGQETTPVGIAFNTDGTKMFIVGISSDTVYEYTLTTGFDLDTATTTGVVSFPIAEDGNPAGLAFNIDGTKMYVMGSTNANVFEYALSVGFDVSTASYNTIFFSVSGQETAPTGMAFNTNGTKMYVVGIINDTVYQYSLTAETVLNITPSGSDVIIDGNFEVTSNVTVDKTLELTPTDPTVVGSFTDATNMASPRGISVLDNYAYVVSSTADSLTILNVTDPTNPTLVTTLTDTTLNRLDGAHGVYVVGSHAYVACADGNALTIVDISTPMTPVIVGTLVDATNMGNAFHVYVSGKHAFVTGNTTKSLAIIDITDPTNPTLTGSFFDTANDNMIAPHGIQVSGNYAYVVSQTSNSLTIIDITDPTTPTLAGQLVDATNFGGCAGLDISGTYAYVTGFDTNSLAVVDVSDPTAPFVAGTLFDNINLISAFGAHISGKYVYVAGFNGDALAVVDISNPAIPILNGVVSDTATMEGAHDVFVSGKHAYVSGETANTLAVIDINGIDASSANIGDIETTYLSVTSNAVVSGDLRTTNLNVGMDALVGGTLSVAGNISSISTEEQLRLSFDGTNFTTFIVDVSSINGASYDDILFSVTSQDVTPNGMHFNTNGSKMYVLGANTETVYQYSLSTEFDISTASYDTVFLDVSLEDISPNDLDFNNDGTKMYIVGNNNDTIFQYTLTTGFDLATASYASIFFSVSTQELQPTGMAFNLDGSKMFVIGTASLAVFEYDLGTSFNVSTAVYNSASFTFSEDVSPQGILFNSDGTRMYIVGATNDEIYQYTLTAGYDISTASYDSLFLDVSPEESGGSHITFNSDFTKLYLTGSVSDGIHQYTMGTDGLTITPTGGETNVEGKLQVVNTDEQLRLKYDSTNYASFTVGNVSGFDLSTTSYDNVPFSVASEDTSPRNIAFNSDKTKMYVVGNATSAIYQYSLTTAGDLSTASYDGDINGKFVISEDSSIQGITFNTAGTKMYISGNTNDSIFQYTMTTAFDISTASYDTVSLSILSEDTVPTGIGLNSDDTKLYVIGQNNKNIYQYSFTTAGDLSTASYDDVSLSIISETTFPQGFTLNSDDTKLYVVDGSTDSIFQYSLTTAGDLSTASYDDVSFSTTTQDGTPLGIAFNSDGTKMYICGNDNDTIYQYSLDVSSTSLTITPTGGETIIDGNLGIDTIPLAKLHVLETTEQLRLGYDSTNYTSFTVDASGFDVSTAVYNSVSFSVAGQDIVPTGMAFNTNGTKMYMIGATNNTVYQYNLSTTFLVSTAVYNSVSFSVAGQDIVPESITFNTDGTKMYIVGANTDTVYQYTLTTGFDLSTATTTGVVSFVIAEDTAPTGMVFNAVGTKMYIVGTTNNTVYQYTLSSAFVVSSATYDSVSFSVAGQDTVPTGITFNAVGTKMYMVGANNDTIYQYILTTAFDLSTATTSGVVSFSVTSEDTIPTGMAFNTNGTSMYVVGNNNNTIYQYTLTTDSSLTITPTGRQTIIDGDFTADNITASNTFIFSDGSTQSQASIPSGFHWDISTSSFLQSFDVSTQETTPASVFFKSDGLKMYVVGEATFTVYEYNLSISWDVSTAVISQSFSLTATENGPTSIFFRSDGLKMYILGNQGSDVNEYDLSIAWDVSTIVFLQVSVTLTTENALPIALWFKPDGLKMYVIGTITNQEVNEYDLSTAWDVSTISFSQVFVTSLTLVRGITFKPDGTSMYLSDATDNTIDEYVLSTAWNISTSVFEQTFDVSAQETFVTGVFFKPDSTKMYIIGSVSDSVYEYDLGLSIDGNVDVAGDITTSLGQVSVLGGNVVEVFTEADLGTVTAGVNIVPASNTTYVLMAPITQTLPIDITTGTSVQYLTTNRSLNTLTYTNTTDTQFRGTDITALYFFDLVLKGSGTGTLFDINGGFVSSKFPDFENYSDLGTVQNLSDFFCPGTFFEIINAGLKFINCTSATIVDSIILSFEGAAVNAFEVSGVNSGQLQFYDNILESDAFANFIRIDPDFSSTTHVNIKGNSVVNSSADLFDITGGTTGTYTAVADNSISATTVTSVTDNGGIAVFTHAGTSPLLGSTVTTSTFSETTYNVTGVVSLTTATTFEIQVSGVDVAFVATDTGSYLMNGVTITSTAHGLLFGASLTLSSDLSTEYDGGGTIYNIQTNSFDVAETFGATQTGTWDTAGINQSDSRVLVNNNPGKDSSETIAEGVTNANTTATTITDGTYGAIDVSTHAIITDERFKLIDTTAAIWEFTGNEPFNGKLTGNLSSIKTGSTQTYRIAMSTNGVVPTFATANYIKFEVKTDTVGTPLEFSVILDTGDIFQLMIAGDGTSDGITVTDLKTGMQ